MRRVRLDAHFFSGFATTGVPTTTPYAFADKTELEHMLVAFNRTETRLRSDWNAYERFAPEHVIGQFSAVFLQGVRGARTSASKRAAQVARPGTA